MKHILTRAFRLQACSMHTQLKLCTYKALPFTCGPVPTRARYACRVRSAATEVAQAEPLAAPQNAPLEQARERREFKPRTTIRQLLHSSGNGTGPQQVDQQVEVRGWVRTVRQQKQFAFMQVCGNRQLLNVPLSAGSM
eukprot:GHUV01048618.1.p1 GENE.GHUV01048618.1~~GHUV01048618.1.p1  ORF type:complete len:138 (+),score=18.67 GHUV01048618.1:253-666(+)